jgi:hypothetical protein
MLRMMSRVMYRYRLNQAVDMGCHGAHAATALDQALVFGGGEVAALVAGVLERIDPDAGRRRRSGSAGGHAVSLPG